MGFKYNDKIHVKSGFYEGVYGRIDDSRSGRSRLPEGRYLVHVGGFTYFIIDEEHLELDKRTFWQKLRDIFR